MISAIAIAELVVLLVPNDVSYSSIFVIYLNSKISTILRKFRGIDKIHFKHKEESTYEIQNQIFSPEFQLN